MPNPTSPLLSERGEDLIVRWRDFVAQAEAGYSLGIEDYRNDLDLRSLIALAGLADSVAHEDARFRKLLVKTDVELWSSDAVDPWWVYGYPGNSGPLLKEDLADENLL